MSNNSPREELEKFIKDAVAAFIERNGLPKDLPSSEVIDMIYSDSEHAQAQASNPEVPSDVRDAWKKIVLNSELPLHVSPMTPLYDASKARTQMMESAFEARTRMMGAGQLPAAALPTLSSIAGLPSLKDIPPVVKPVITSDTKLTDEQFLAQTFMERIEGHCIVSEESEGEPEDDNQRKHMYRGGMLLLDMLTCDGLSLPVYALNRVPAHDPILSNRKWKATLSDLSDAVDAQYDHIYRGMNGLMTYGEVHDICVILNAVAGTYIRRAICEPGVKLPDDKIEFDQPVKLMNQGEAECILLVDDHFLSSESGDIIYPDHVYPQQEMELHFMSMAARLSYGLRSLLNEDGPITTVMRKLKFFAGRKELSDHQITVVARDFSSMPTISAPTLSDRVKSTADEIVANIISMLRTGPND